MGGIEVTIWFMKMIDLAETHPHHVWEVNGAVGLCVVCCSQLFLWVAVVAACSKRGEAGFVLPVAAYQLSRCTSNLMVVSRE